MVTQQAVLRIYTLIYSSRKKGTQMRLLRKFSRCREFVGRVHSSDFVVDLFFACTIHLFLHEVTASAYKRRIKFKFQHPY